MPYTPIISPDALVEMVSEAAAAGVENWAGVVLESALEIVPVDTGELRDSGHVIVSQNYAAVEFDSDHAVFVEYGTGIRGAASPGAGPGPYDPNWPGMRAQPYLRPAFDQHQEEAASMMADSISAALQ